MRSSYDIKGRKTWAGGMVMCVCVYVCMYVCMYVYDVFGSRLVARMILRGGRRGLEVWLCVCVCMCVCMYVYNYVCICTHTHTHISQRS